MRSSINGISMNHYDGDDPAVHGYSWMNPDAGLFAARIAETQSNYAHEEAIVGRPQAVTLISMFYKIRGRTAHRFPQPHRHLCKKDLKVLVLEELMAQMREDTHDKLGGQPVQEAFAYVGLNQLYAISGSPMEEGMRRFEESLGSFQPSTQARAKQMLQEGMEVGTVPTDRELKTLTDRFFMDGPTYHGTGGILGLRIRPR